MAKHDIIKRFELRFYEGDERLVEWLESNGSNVTSTIKRALHNEMTALGRAEGVGMDYGKIRNIISEELSRIALGQENAQPSTILEVRATVSK